MLLVRRLLLLLSRWSTHPISTQNILKQYSLFLVWYQLIYQNCWDCISWILKSIILDSHEPIQKECNSWQVWKWSWQNSEETFDVSSVRSIDQKERWNIRLLCFSSKIYFTRAQLQNMIRRPFSHPSAEKQYKLLKISRPEDTAAETIQFLNDLSKICDPFIRIKNSPNRFSVTFGV